MSEVRQVQRESDRPLRGKTFLSDGIQSESKRTRDHSGLLAELARSSEGYVPPNVQQLAFERFEEMCRRRKLSIPKELRPPIYRLLALELVVNSSVLQAEPEQIASATLYNGSLDEMVSRFADFRDTPWIFRHVAVNNPSDPEGFLTGVLETITRLSADERFADFRDTPGIFQRAAVHNSSDPEGFLTGVLETITRLSADERFADFRDTPGIFRQAAVNNPSDPESYLADQLRARHAAGRRTEQFSANDDRAKPDQWAR
jgi:hypothetical protein